MSQTRFFRQCEEKVLVFDGGMGTCIQEYHLTVDDFEGLEGCNEYLVKTRPEVIQEIHAAYFQAGADVVETNSFGSSRIVLAEYDIAEQAYSLSFEAARLAKAVAQDYSQERPRFVAGSIGPTTKLPTLGHIPYALLKAAYVEQVRGLVDGGVDILLIETCQDLLQTKAALAAVTQVKQQMGRAIPVMVQVTIEAVGTMLVGSDIATVVAAMAPYEIDVLGMNCATGPQEMSEHVRYLAQYSPFYVSCLPNAGIPENRGGKAHYALTPEGLAQYLEHFVTELGVSIVGGCCGTTPSHIRLLADRVGGLSPKPRDQQAEVRQQPMLTSLYSTVPMRITPAPVIVGERTNANGSKRFCELLAQEDYDGLVGIGRNQVQEGAHLLDVCTAYVGRDEARDMEALITRLNSQVDSPIMIDSTETPVIERALAQLAGRAIVNSINLEDGETRLEEVLPLCKEFGAAVVALTIDEEGMAKTAEKKLAIAERIYDLAVNRYGMKPEDLVFDPLTFTLGSGDEEFRRAGVETIEAIRLIKAKLPRVGTILGVSNISFGLKMSARHVLNSVFLHYAIEAGLDMAIINSKHLLPLHQIQEEERALCRALIFNEPAPTGEDPLMALIAYYEANEASVSGKSKVVTLPEVLEARLTARIVQGDRTGLAEDLDQALLQYPALEIINTYLLDGMRVVGELFGKGEMQLPFVLQSAEVMKTAVAHLEPHMDKSEGGQNKGSIVLATVKGDVHDIGKNLVDILLTNNGYRVINLGIKQSLDAILQAAEAEQVDAIGMSGLLVKSTAIMKENLAVMQERKLSIPVILGGAALTERFVREDCQAEYAAPVFYAKDAFSGLHAMQQICTGEALKVPSAKEDTVSEPAIYQAVGELLHTEDADMQLTALYQDTQFSSHVLPVTASQIPLAPFYGTQVVREIDLDAVYPYLNQQALIAGQWQVKRGRKSPQEHEQFVQETLQPVLDRLKQESLTRKWLAPQVVYGYFPCQSEGNSLIVYEADQKTERQRFLFPRGGSKRLCIADYFASVDSGIMDTIAFQLVTVGQCATEHAQMLFQSGQYQDYLYFHGFSVEMAEALAEYWHAQIRKEWGIHGEDAPNIKQQLGKGYRGCRYSFGYPACPRLEDQADLMRLLPPEQIGVRLSEEFMLEPEQSTSALVVHHPQAAYFDVRAGVSV